MRCQLFWIPMLCLVMAAPVASAQVAGVRPMSGSSESDNNRLASCIAASRLRTGQFHYKANEENEDVVNALTIHQSEDSTLLFIGEENKRVVGIGLFGSLGSVVETIKDQAMLRVVDMRSGEETKRIPCGEATEISSVSATVRAESVVAISRHAGDRAVSRQLGAPISPAMLTKASSTTGELQIKQVPAEWNSIQCTKRLDNVLVTNNGSIALNHVSENGTKTIWSRDVNIDANVDPWICQVSDAVLVPCLGRTEKDPLFKMYRLSDGQVASRVYSGKDIPTSTEDRRVSLLTTSKDDKYVAIGCNGFMVIMDRLTGTEVRRLGIGDETLENRCPLCARFSDDNRTVDVVWSKDWNLTRWELDSGEKISSSMIAGPPLQFSRNGRFIFLETETGTVEIADSQTGLQLLKFHLFHTDRRWLVETIDGYFASSDELFREEQLLLTDVGLTHDPAKVKSLLDELLDTKQPDSPKPASPNRSAKNERNSYVLTYGVSQHKYDEYNLKYAAIDSEDFSTKFRQVAAKSFGEIRYESKTNDDVTLKTIRDGLAWLERSTTENDTAVIFFAGHGIKGRNGLYFVPHAGDFQAMQSSCLNWSEVAESIGRLKAKHIVMLVDCCHAGAFGKDHRATSAELTAGLKSQKGLYLLCSSSESEVSLEKDGLKHGVFTQAVLESLTPKADLNSDKALSFREFTKSITQRVSQLTNEQQNPILPFENAIDLDQTFVHFRD